MDKVFYVFRHGETPLNAKNIWQGTSADPKLTERGEKQAAGLGQKLVGLGIEKIYCSPFLRAKQTANIVNEFVQAPIEMRENLRECCFGVAEGRTMAEVSERWLGLMQDILYPTPETWDRKYPGEGSESKHQVFDRVHKTLLAIARCSDEQVIGISTHGGVMSSLLAGLNSFGVDLPNCCVAEIKYDAKTEKLSFVKML